MTLLVEQPPVGVDDAGTPDRSEPTPASPDRIDLGSVARGIAEQQVPRTVWGLDPVGLHARYWASYGVHVVRTGGNHVLPRDSELFLLLSDHGLPLFPLASAVRVMKWVEPTVLSVRLAEHRNDGYREVVDRTTDYANPNRFVQFTRIYDGAALRRMRVVLTPNLEMAELWQHAEDTRTAMRKLRDNVPPGERAAINLGGRVYSAMDDREVALMLKDLVSSWDRPHATISRAKALSDNGAASAVVTRAGTTFVDASSSIRGVRFFGPVWVGAGRTIEEGTTVVGPRVVWDSPQHRPQPHETEVAYDERERAAPSPSAETRGARSNGTVSESVAENKPDTFIAHRPSEFAEVGKRVFDIVASFFAIIVFLPVGLVLAAVILWTDGWPVFYGQEREGLGQRKFRCWKFRSMYLDADERKAQLIAEGKNEADGEQFFMRNDPRVTPVGRVMRKTNLDELPQFWNVLVGEMSIVGPRPSPKKENQNDAAWRQTRLSVRPGITGLWQVRRTRAEGTDFQEWVKYDLTYVRTRTFWGDIVLIIQTVQAIFRKLTRE